MITYIKKFVYNLYRLFFETLLMMEFYGLENVPTNGPAIIVANHQSYLDIPVVAISCFQNLINMTWVVSKANAKMLALKPLWLVYKKINAGGGAIENAKKELYTNRFVVMFPEGSRRWCMAKGIDKKIGNGAAALALSTGAPIIPIGIYGTDKAFPPDASKFDRTQKIRARVGKPFSFEPIQGESIDQATLENATNIIMSRIKTLIPADEAVSEVYNLKAAKGPSLQTGFSCAA